MRRMPMIYTALTVLFLIAIFLLSDEDDPELVASQPRHGLWQGELDDLEESRGVLNIGTSGANNEQAKLYRQNAVSCYTYREKEDARGNPQRYRLERPRDQLESRRCKKRMPHGLVIGVKKGGTTALVRYVDLHPMVSISHPVQPGPTISNETMAAWRDTFSLASARQMAFTGYPGFFTDMQPQLFDVMRHYLPDDVRLILILRDPVERLVSDYVHTQTIADRLGRGEERRRFMEREGLRDTLAATVLNELGEVNPFASIVRMGVYAIDLHSLLQQFRRERILIVDGNEFRRDPLPTLLDVESFLRLPPFFKRDHFKYDKEKNFYCAHVPFRPDVTCLNSQKGRGHPDINEALRRKLKDFYYPYNQELKTSYGLNLSWA